MNDPHHLAALLSLYERRRLEGQPLSDAELQNLCRQHPEALTELRRQIALEQTGDQYPNLPADSAEDPHATLGSITSGGEPATVDHQPSPPGTGFPADSDSRPEDLPPTVGRYVVGPELKKGGMGRIIRVWDEDFKRSLALKLVRDRHPKPEQRLVYEGRLTGCLQHPGIPPVHDQGHLPDGRPYFVMKLIQGSSLSELLRKRQSPAAELPRFLLIYEQLCAAVGYAHSQQVIHRDLKPGNIMVGAFGEVQVIDWGLAKGLEGASAQWPTSAADEPDAAFGLRQTVATAGTDTTAHTVLGTPAYMAPEQARGELSHLDARADVFGLGAILCEVLTGSPPYRGRDLQQVLHRARGADLAEALARVKNSGADGDLVVLARACLANDPNDRPADGSAVAAAVAVYRQEVQRRLKVAEIETAAAAARAEEEVRRRKVERQRRRTAVALAAALVLLVVGGCAWGLWFKEERVRQEQQSVYLDKAVESALTDADASLTKLHAYLDHPEQAHVLLSEPRRWEVQLQSAEAARLRAAKLAEGGDELLDANVRARLGRLNARLKQEQEAFAVAQKLDRVALKTTTVVDGHMDFHVAAREYPGVFAEFGLAVTSGEPAALAARIVGSPARYALVAALDHWAFVLSFQDNKVKQSQVDFPLQKRLLEIARRADPETWRDRFRDAQVWTDQPRLQKLAAEVNVKKQSPQVLVALAHWLHPSNPLRAEVLRQAVSHHPRDFWLYFYLGLEATNAVERVGWYQAAVAIRPESSTANYNLGSVLLANQDPKRALTQFEIAIQLDRNYAKAYYGLALALTAQNDVQEAMAAFRKVIELEPDYLAAYLGLGNALLNQKDYRGAASLYRKAIVLGSANGDVYYNQGLILYELREFDESSELFRKAIAVDNKFVHYYTGLGNALRARKDYQGALEQYQTARNLDPKDANAYFNLGITYADLKKLPEAADQYRQAIELDRNHTNAYINLGRILRQQKDVKGAIEQYRQAIKLDNKNAETYIFLGNALHEDKDLNGAIDQFRKASAIDPKNPLAYYNYGLALYDQKQLKEAIEQYRQSIALDSNFAPAYHNLGAAYADLKQFDQAIAQYHKAIAIDPKFAQPHYNLGKAFQEQNDLKSASVHYRKAIALDPNFAPAYNNLGNILHNQKDIPGAIAQYRQAIAADPNYAPAYYNLGNLFFEQKDYPEAIAQFRKASETDPHYAQAFNNLGNTLYYQKDYPAAIVQFRKALAIDPHYARAHYNLGRSLLHDGQFTESLQATRQMLNLLPASHPWIKIGQDQLQQCENLLVIDRQLGVYLGQGKTPKKTQEVLSLIQLCRSYKHYPATAARLYTAAFSDQPALAERLEKQHRYQAAYSALQAVAGQGRDPVKLTPADKTLLRAQALAWLKADLQQWTKQFQARNLQALPGLLTHLPAWQQEATFAAVRDKELAKLSADEQKDWATLWGDVDKLLKQLAANVRSERFTGTLTAKDKELTHEVKLQAGLPCVIDLESPQFDTFLKLQDATGTTLDENDDLAPDNLNSRLFFTPTRNDTYRLVATSFEQRGTGAYTLTVRHFTRNEK